MELQRTCSSQKNFGKKQKKKRRGLTLPEFKTRSYNKDGGALAKGQTQVSGQSGAQRQARAGTVGGFLTDTRRFNRERDVFSK